MIHSSFNGSQLLTDTLLFSDIRDYLESLSSFGIHDVVFYSRKFSSIYHLYLLLTSEKTLPKLTHFLFYLSSLCLPFTSQPFIVWEKLIGTCHCLGKADRYLEYHLHLPIHTRCDADIPKPNY